MQDWQKRMLHMKAVRNALALCNGKDPTSFKDTEGTLEVYNPMPFRWNGKVFWKHMETEGHTSSSYHACKCSSVK